MDIVELIVFFCLTSFAHLLITGIAMAAGYLYGNYLGKKQYEMAKTQVTEEIRTYIKGEFLTDLTTAVRDQLNGILGPVARAGTNEARMVAAQYAQANPGIASLLTSVAAKGAARWLGKQLGVPKDVVDALGGASPFMPIQLPGAKKGDPDLQPVVVPGGGPH